MSIDVHRGDADCLFLRGLLLCCGASLPFLSFIPAPVPLFPPLPSLLPDALCLSWSPPAVKVQHLPSHQPSILQHHVLWEMAKGAAADV